MYFHSKAPKQALMFLQVQNEIAVAGIKNNDQLTDEEKKIALKKRISNFILILFSLPLNQFYVCFKLISKPFYNVCS